MIKEKNMFEAFVKFVGAVCIHVSIVLLALLIAHKWLNWF